MAVFATTTWARKAKLVTAGKDWEIQVRLLANGKHPTDRTASLRSTELWLMIAKDLYWVDIQHGGKCLSVAFQNKGPPTRHDSALALPDPDLATFATWLTAAEASFGKPFRRDKLWVQSNIKGGRDAVVRWIENGFTWS